MSQAAGSLLVVDVGTSGVRSAIVRPDATVDHVHYTEVLPTTPAPGLVEVDAARIATAVLETARAALADGGPVAGVGVANQRCTTVVWDRRTGQPVAPAIGWQDLRTVGTCLVLQGEGLRLAPNVSATKLAAILDDVDPDRRRAANGELCFGTIDSWVIWTLTNQSAAAGHATPVHVTDATNAAVTGLVAIDPLAWDSDVLQKLNIPTVMLPAIVDSSGEVGEATTLDGAPLICGIAGDQQASLVGQGCTKRGLTKATFGTGGMLDLCLGPDPDPDPDPDAPDNQSGASPTRPESVNRGRHGTFPIVAWQRHGRPTWGVEAVMLSAGSCIEWLRDDLGLIKDAAESATLAAEALEATDSPNQPSDVWFVPALLGMGTPVWDFGARGTLLGLTRGTRRQEVVLAVLQGIAHRGADLLEAAEADSGLEVGTLRVDGGMSANHVFVSALAEAVGRPVEVSPVLEATTLGAGYLAGMAVGTWQGEDDVARSFTPARTVEPAAAEAVRRRTRERWLDARARAERTIPDLSGIDF